MSLSQRYQEILGRISGAKARRLEGGELTLVAVSKNQPIEKIEELYSLGHRDFGENYSQELCSKAKEMAAKGYTDLRWHFIGHLQTNKVKDIVPWVYSVHSVDSEKLALELAKRWSQRGRSGTLPCFVEVNLDGEETKMMPHGFADQFQRYGAERRIKRVAL